MERKNVKVILVSALIGALVTSWMFLSLTQKNQNETYRDTAIGKCDWNEDGHIDVFVIDHKGRAYVYINDGKGQFTKQRESILKAPKVMYLSSTIGGDYNGDGKMDFFKIDSKGKVYVYFDDGRG